MALHLNCLKQQPFRQARVKGSRKSKQSFKTKKMKIMIPVINDEAGKYTLAESFHNAEYACIYETDSKNYEWVKTTDLSEKSENLSFELKRKGILSVLINKMSPMALGLFIESGFKVFQAESTDMKENLDLFHQRLLKYYKYAVEDFSDPCAGSCGSCSTSNSSCNL